MEPATPQLLTLTQTPPAEHTKWTHIHLGALRRNVQHLRQCAPRSQIMGVVKANAYGHHIDIVVPALAAEGVRHFGVATLAEALALKNLLAYAPPDMILVLGAMPTHQYARAVGEGLQFMLHTPGDLPLVAQLARNYGKRAQLHLKIDTGMGRVGFMPEELPEVLEQCLNYAEEIEIVGVCSHMATADDPDPSHALSQIAAFAKCRRMCENHALFATQRPLFHLANSDAALKFPESHHDLIRPGIALYGYTGVEAQQAHLSPVLSLHSQIVQRRRVPAHHPIGYGKTFTTSRESELALVSIGYEDGIPRRLSNQFRVVYRGQFLPVIGRVSMDQCMVDLSDYQGDLPRVGEYMTLLSQDLPAYLWSERLDTIPYEILTGLGQRLPRIPIPA